MIFGLSITLWRWIGYGSLALTLLATVWGVKAEWDAGQAAIKQQASLVAVAKTQTAAVAKADKTVAASDAKAQTTIVTRTRTLIQKVPTYVTKTTPCIPWSVVRLHDAAVLGVNPSTLQLPAGQADDACSTVDPTTFVDTVIANYGAAEANAQQLDDLIEDARTRQATVAPAAPGTASPLAPVKPAA